MYICIYTHEAEGQQAPPVSEAEGTTCTHIYVYIYIYIYTYIYIYIYIERESLDLFGFLADDMLLLACTESAGAGSRTSIIT